MTQTEKQQQQKDNMKAIITSEGRQELQTFRKKPEERHRFKNEFEGRPKIINYEGKKKMEER